MNIDLIIKLAKLANNNPSEHEANSAARRVCKLLAEGNFEFGIVRTTTPDFQSTRPPWNSQPVDDVYDILEELRRKRKATYQRTAEQYRRGTWTTPESQRDWYEQSQCTHNWVYVANKEQYLCIFCNKVETKQERHARKPESKRCIHCRKIMTEPAEIANKICGDCWRKEREKFGL